MPGVSEEAVTIPTDDVELDGDLSLPPDADGLVVFAHGSGSSRKSPRNNAVADELNDRGLGTLLFDLLTEIEDQNRANRFDIELLTDRLLAATEWVESRSSTAAMTPGYFGASTGAAAALRAAAEKGADVGAVVSRGGRVDLAEEKLPEVTAPSLFIVGSEDTDVLKLNREAYDELTCEKELSVVQGAGHLFEGPGQLEEVSDLAGDWFEEYIG